MGPGFKSNMDQHLHNSIPYSAGEGAQYVFIDILEEIRTLNMICLEQYEYN